MKDRENFKKNSGWRIAGKVLSYAVLALAVLLLVMAVAARATGKPFRVFGYSFHIVVTDSMTGELEVGDFIVARKGSVEDVEIGRDAVVYRAQNGLLKDKFIVHRAVGMTETEGVPALLTQGVKPGAPVDQENGEPPVTEIVGIYVWKSAFLGHLILFFTKPLNLIFIAVLGVLAYVCFRLIRRILSEKKKEE